MRECNSDKYLFINSAAGVIKLIIKNPTKDDIGNYTCIAENRSRNTSESITHDITAKTIRSIPDQEQIIIKKEKPQATSRQPISFESFLKNMTIEEGTTAKFICSIRGPFSLAIWTKDGKVITANDRLLPGSTDALVYLEIKNPEPSDSGNYAVSVSNDITEMSSNAQLNVYPNVSLRNKELNASKTVETKGKLSVLMLHYFLNIHLVMRIV